MRLTYRIDPSGRATVEFPNNDSVFHNVYAAFGADMKRGVWGWAAAEGYW